MTGTLLTAEAEREQLTKKAQQNMRLKMRVHDDFEGQFTIKKSGEVVAQRTLILIDQSEEDRCSTMMEFQLTRTARESVQGHKLRDTVVTVAIKAMRASFTPGMIQISNGRLVWDAAIEGVDTLAESEDAE
jgi:hypothetical protein